MDRGACAPPDPPLPARSLPSRRFQRSLIGHSNWVRSAAFSPDARLVVSGGDDKTVRLWDAAEGAQLATFYEHSECVPPRPRERRRVTPPAPRPQHRPHRSVRPRRHLRRGCSAGRQRQPVGCAEPPSDPALRRPRRRRVQHALPPLRQLPLHGERGRHVEGARSTAAHADRRAPRRLGNPAPYPVPSAQVWDLREGHLLYTIEGHGGGVRALGSTAGGAHFATGGDDSLVMVWNARFARQFPPVGRSTAGAEAREKELFSPSRGEGAEAGKGRSRRGRTGQKALAPRPRSAPRSGATREQDALAAVEGETMGAGARWGHGPREQRGGAPHSAGPPLRARLQTISPAATSPPAARLARPGAAPPRGRRRARRPWRRLRPSGRSLGNPFTRARKGRVCRRSEPATARARRRRTRLW